LLGAGRVIACDNDPDAVAVARAQAAAYIGSVDAASPHCADVAGISHRLPKDKRPQECGRGRHECLRHSPIRQTVLDDVAQALVPAAPRLISARGR